MQRDLAKLAAGSYDLLVVGGGITGACIAWDAALRGLKVALVEKGDFGAGTTSGSSKLVHGGLRYLQNGEFGLVRESLRERRVWSRIAPHMVFPLPFLVPTYGWGKRSGPVLEVGLTLYDLLSYDRNRLDDPEKHLPGHTSFTRAQAAQAIDGLDQEDLTGAKLYYDCLMPYPERLCLAVLKAAVAAGAEIANHAEVERFEVEASGDMRRVTGVCVRDGIAGGRHEVSARTTVNAAGPWGDLLLGMAEGGAPSRPLLRSKGIHIVVPEISARYAFAVMPEKGGHFFVIPWRGHTLIGTTDTAYEANPDTLGVTETDIEAFIATIDNGLPGLGLTRDQVLYAYAGLRPLIAPKAGTNSYSASRDAAVFDHGDSGGPAGLLSAMGGKWTTSRALAEEVVDKVLAKRGERAACTTAETRLPGGETGRISTFLAEQRARYGDLDAASVDHLAALYGSEMDAVLGGGQELDRREVIEPGEPAYPDLFAEVFHAVEQEMAFKLDDVLFRRTGIGTLGRPPTALVDRVAQSMGRLLRWDRDRVAAEKHAALSRFDYR